MIWQLGRKPRQYPWNSRENKVQKIKERNAEIKK
jgi:hypothetical protein